MPIILTAAVSARCATSQEATIDGIGTKRPASRDLSKGAVRQTHHRREIERLTATDQNLQHPASRRHEVAGAKLQFWNSNKSSLYNVKTEQAGNSEELLQTLFANDLFLHHPLDTNPEGLVEPDGIEPTTSCLQSRRSPS